MITASSLPRLMNCPSSAALPKAETANRWADLGNEEHADLAEQVVSGTLPPYLAALMPPNPRVEVALAFDVSTGVGRIIGDNLGRSYGDLAPFEICGSADVLGIDGDAVVVIDFKTGARDVEPAATNAQLKFYALAACRALQRDRAVIRIIYTQTRRCDEAEMDALDLAAFAADVERLHVVVAERKAKAARGETLDTREGSWCRHCSSAAYCGSKNALLVQVASNGLAVVGDAALTPDRARAACEQVLRVEQLVQDARKRLEAYVTANGPIDLGDGKRYGRYVRPGNERVRGDIAMRAIREVCGELVEPFAAEAIEVKTSKAAIKRAAKAVGEPQLEKAVMGRVRALGGIDKAPDSMPIGEFTADKYEAAPLDDGDVDAINAALESA